MNLRAIIGSGRPSVSFEIFPPKRPEPSLFGETEAAAAMERTKEVVRKIAAEHPAFISVTYGAAGGTTGANTAAIAQFVQDECHVPALAHLTCITSSRDRIADEIVSFREKGIENILCLRGDYPPGMRDEERGMRGSGEFHHAIDLVRACRSSSLIPHPSSLLPIYYSGPIDALFGYKFGPLPWRTLRFELERVNRPDVQGTTVVNYVDADVPFTRQHEYKHFHPEWPKSGKTIICREYSASWKQGDEPYYPIANAESSELLTKYQAEAAKVPSLVVGGRLGQYKYFDMDKSVAAALKVEIA